MKEPNAPQAFFDGSLKELAARHLGLIKAVLFMLIVAAPLSVGLIAFFEDKRHWDAGSNSYVYDFPLLRPWGFGLAFLLSAYAVLNLLFRFYRLAALLYPHVCLYFTLMLLVPFLNILVILLIWWIGVRQMGTRGLRVGLFGIDPAKVE
jgi:hypothetical protein